MGWTRQVAHRYKGKTKSEGFALPTVLVASVVMMVVLLAALTGVSSISAGIRNQYVDQIGRSAAKSGIAMANACMKKNGGSITWTDAKPLKPNTDCTGTENISCPSSSTDVACYVLKSGNYRTAFSVGIVSDSGGTPTDFNSQGIVRQVRTTSGDVVMQTNSSVKVSISISGSSSAWMTFKAGSLSAGYYGTCALDLTNNVYCWGAAKFDNTIAKSLIPVAVSRGAMPADVTASSISIGGSHACLIGSDNKAYCWGSNSSGQLGDGTTTTSSTPVAVAQGAIPAGVTFKSISVGSSFTCALGSNDKAYCWGDNTYAQFGNNTTTASYTPVAVSRGAMPIGSTFKSIAAAENGYVCGIGSNDKAYCWGFNSNGQLGNNSTGTAYTPVAVAQGAMPAGTTFKSITTNSYHTCGIGSNDKAYCWGSNSSGQLGDNTTTQRLTPVAVAQGAMPAGSTFKGIAAGQLHSCGIGSNNMLYCWGDNTYGQLGDSTQTQRLTPVATSQGSIPAGVTFDSIKAGYSHTCVLGSDSNIYCWGADDSAQLGDGAMTPSRSVPVTVPTGVIPTSVTLTSISAGSTQSCATVSDNKAYCWGSNQGGYLGNGISTSGVSGPSATPFPVVQGAMPAGVTFKSVSTSATGNHTCGIGSNDKAYCWGYNSYGVLGDNTTTSQPTPTAVAQGAMPAGVTFKSISAGGSHTCAIGSNDKAYCWGNNSNGQLGNNGSIFAPPELTPVAVAQGDMPAGVTFKSISAGGINTCAIGSDNKAYCWGDNTFGEGGNTTYLNTNPAPVAVVQGAIPAGVTFKSIATGNNHTCAIGSNDKAYCWGNNGSGQLGDNTTTTRTIPVAVVRGAMPVGATYKSITLGISYTCTISSEDKAYCWGLNDVNQLGDNTVTTRRTAVLVNQGAVPAGGTYKSISASRYTTCAIASDNRGYCWGKNDYYQISGEGNPTYPTPWPILQVPATTSGTGSGFLIY